MNDTTTGPGVLADVALSTTGDRWTLIFSRDLQHPPRKVWAAVTDPDQLARWAPFLASRDLSITGEATLTMVDGDVRQDVPATVTRSEPHTLLEYTWGTDVLRWELAATDPTDPAVAADPTDGGPGRPANASTATGSTGTRLTLRHTVAGRDWIPKAAAGWHLCLVVAERLLDGHGATVVAHHPEPDDELAPRLAAGQGLHRGRVDQEDHDQGAHQRDVLERTIGAGGGDERQEQDAGGEHHYRGDVDQPGGHPRTDGGGRQVEGDGLARDEVVRGQCCELR